MIKINYKSDFKINESSETVAMEVPFVFSYYVFDNKKYVVSFDGHNYVNCERKEDGSLDVIFNQPDFGIGHLKVERKYAVDDKAFADGVFDVVTVDKTDVFITSGQTFETYVKTLVVPPFLKGDKGDPMTWDTMTETERGELVHDVAEAIDPEMVMTENEKLRQEAERSRQTAEQQRSSTFNTLKGEMQSAITAGNAAAGNAQKVVDEYDTKVAEQDSKLSELGSEVYTILNNYHESVSISSGYDRPKLTRNILLLQNIEYTITSERESASGVTYLFLMSPEGSEIVKLYSIPDGSQKNTTKYTPKYNMYCYMAFTGNSNTNISVDITSNVSTPYVYNLTYNMIGEFDESASYKSFSFVKKGDSLAQFIRPHIGSWDENDVQSVNILDVILEAVMISKLADREYIGGEYEVSILPIMLKNTTVNVDTGLLEKYNAKRLSTSGYIHSDAVSVDIKNGTYAIYPYGDEGYIGGQTNCGIWLTGYHVFNIQGASRYRISLSKSDNSVITPMDLEFMDLTVKSINNGGKINYYDKMLYPKGVVVSLNHFDKNQAEEGHYYLWNTGEKKEREDIATSGLIACSEGEKWWSHYNYGLFSGGNVSFWDKDGNYISGIDISNEFMLPFIIPYGVSYFRISMYKGRIPTFCLNKNEKSAFDEFKLKFGYNFPHNIISPNIEDIEKRIISGVDRYYQATLGGTTYIVGRSKDYETSFVFTVVQREDYEGNIVVPKIKGTSATSELGNLQCTNIVTFAKKHDYEHIINAGIFLVDTMEADGITIIDGNILKSTICEQFDVEQYVLGITGNGDFKYYRGVSADTILSDGCIYAVTGFVPLIDDSSVMDESILSICPHYDKKHPRQIVGTLSNGNYFTFCCDGRTEGELGMTLSECIDTMKKIMPIKFAFNLDGGGSTQSCVRKKQINRAIDNRRVPNAIVFE